MFGIGLLQRHTKKESTIQGTGNVENRVTAGTKESTIHGIGTIENSVTTETCKKESTIQGTGTIENRVTNDKLERDGLQIHLS